MYGMMVRELIEEDKNEWKVDVIKKVFNESETENSYSCGLWTRQEKKAMLKIHKHREYTVKSAYHCTIESLMDNCKLGVEGN
jgi:hypothetical protein